MVSAIEWRVGRKFPLCPIAVVLMNRCKIRYFIMIVNTYRCAHILIVLHTKRMQISFLSNVLKSICHYLWTHTLLSSIVLNRVLFYIRNFWNILGHLSVAFRYFYIESVLNKYAKNITLCWAWKDGILDLLFDNIWQLHNIFPATCDI